MDKNKPLNAYRTELKITILHEARRLFHSRGIKAVKMSELAVGLGISKRTLYEIYNDKESLLIACLQFTQEEFLDKMMSKTNDGCNVIELLAKFLNLHLEMMKEYSPAFMEDLQKFPRAIQFLDTNAEERAKHVKSFYAKGVEQGFLRADIDSNMLFRMFNITIRETGNQEMYKSYPVNIIFRNVFLVYLRGMCTPEGITLLDKLIE